MTSYELNNKIKKVEINSLSPFISPSFRLKFFNLSTKRCKLFWC